MREKCRVLLAVKRQFMMKSFNLKALAIAGALSISSAMPVCAATPIFDNTVNDLSIRFNTGFYEVGEQIILAPGNDRMLQTFSFEFWGTNTANPTSFAGGAAVEARVRFYENNGPLYHGYASPGTKFYDSLWFSVPAPTVRDTFTFSAGLDFPVDGLFIPADTLTWTIQFRGMESTDSLGVDLYSPPVVGTEYTDYWQNDGTGGWLLLTNGVSMSVDFAAYMDANPAIPEPSIGAISILGGLGMLGWAYRLRRNG